MSTDTFVQASVTQADRNWPYRVTATYTDGKTRVNDYAETFEPVGFARHISQNPDVARVEVTTSFVDGEQVAAPSPFAAGPWRELREKLIKDAADYRDSRNHYRRLHDTTGALIADASLTTVNAVLAQMDLFERQAMRTAESGKEAGR